ncbi:MAG TPA: HAMP domain-containing sensor histidine kinase [Candidatus Bathyarchaeia archaeon]|nr:HAMP domain-containing sensor histidine kinase [Candidatus Bathyarchaeia archaeon]
MHSTGNARSTGRGAARLKPARRARSEKSPLVWHERLLAELAASTDSLAALGAVCRVVRESLPCDRVQVWRGDIRQMTMFTLISSGYDQRDAARLAALAPSITEMPLQSDFLARKSLEIENTREIPGTDEIFTLFGVEAALFLLLERGDRVLGALQLSWCGASPVEFPCAEIRDIIRRHVGLAVDIHARTDEAIAVSETLSQTAKILGQIHDPEELLRAVARKCAEAIGCDWATVHLSDETTGRMRFAAGFGLTTTPALERLAISPAAVERRLAAAEEGIVEVIDLQSVAALRAHFESLPVASFVSLPLRQDAQLSGLLSLGFHHRTGRFSRRQITLAKGLANHALVALRNAQLVRSLEETNQFKADFIAAVSHDLRTPLHVLIGYNDMLLGGEGGDLGAVQRRLVSRMRECSVRFLGLIDSILDIGRLDAGRDSVRLAPISLVELCAELAREAEDLKPEQIDLRTHASADPVVTDAAKVKTILRNLMANALKFTVRGHVDILAQADASGAIVLEVSDTGPGINPTERQKIFDMFHQGSAGRRAGGSGLGLGLYLVRRLAEMLGGSVELSSGEPGNTVFRVSLPPASSPR